MTRVVSSGATVAIVAALLLVPGQTSQAQEGAEKIYKEGIDAAKAHRWPVVVTTMRQAIDMNPNEAPGGKKLFLLRDIDYFPHLLLGRALAEQKDCTGALNAWEESDRQGIARKKEENAKEIDRGYAQCEMQGFLPPIRYHKELDDAKVAVRAAADEARRLAEHVAPYGDTIKAAHRKQVTPAESRMQTANDKLTSGEKTRRAQDLTDARAAATLALTEYRAARPPLDALIAAVGSFQEKVRSAERDVSEAEGLGRDFDAAVRDAPIKISPGDATLAARSKADAAIASAREKIQAAGRAQSESALGDVAKLLEDARQNYLRARGDVDGLIRAGVDQELQSIQSRLQNMFTGLEGRADQIEEALRAQPELTKAVKDLEAAQKGLVRARQAFDRALRARELKEARAVVQQAQRLGSQLDVLAAGLPIVAPTLPDALKAAAQAFFDGAYGDAIKLLPADQVGAIDQHFRIHAHVVRAAALFGLYQQTGGADASLREQAQREVAESRTLDPAFQPNPAAFSPRFLAFFRSGPGQAP